MYNTGSKDILTGHTLIIFPLSFLELSASFVELQLTWLGATSTTYLPPTGKASPTVDGDAAREPHSAGDAMSGTGKGEGETWGLCTKEMVGWEDQHSGNEKWDLSVGKLPSH